MRGAGGGAGGKRGGGGEVEVAFHLVREPGGRTVHPPPPHPPGTFHYGPKNNENRTDCCVI